MYLIDTNILAYFIKQNPRVCEKFISKEDEIVLCSVVQAECLFGAKKIASQNLIAIYDTIFQTYSVFSFDSQSSQIFTDLKVKLTKTGKIIEDFDLMIASI
jgi:tRNA(fMet)-specific endonuclease VapC